MPTSQNVSSDRVFGIRSRVSMALHPIAAAPTFLACLFYRPIQLPQRLRNNKMINVPATIGFTLLGSIIASLLSKQRRGLLPPVNQ
jgi:hypothetical protein